MSARNGDKARHERRRKKRILQRAKIRALVASTKGPAVGRAGTK